MAGRKAHAIGVALLLALTTACGSTVQLKSTQTLGGGTGSTTGGTGDGLGQPLGGTTGGTSGGSTGLGTAGTTGGGSTGSGTSGSAGGTTGGTTGIGTTGGGSFGKNAPGVTDTKVYVGFVYDKNAGKVNEAAGVGSISSGDSRANTNAIIKDINAHGGLGGRKLEPVWGNFDSTSAQTLDQQFASLCQTFTVDNHVFAVDGAGNASYKQCMSKAGVLMLSSDLPTEGAQELRSWPAVIEQGYPNMDRLASFFVQPLIAQKYFTPWDSVNGQPAAAGAIKVGILTYDNNVFKRAVDTLLVPALKRLGYDPIVERIAPLTRAADISSQAAAVKSAQLTFAANGVTHVIPFESNGGLSTLFMPTARSQKYYPRYGVFTGSAAEALVESGAIDPAQYNGAVGFGWMPSVDLPTAMNPPNSAYSNANRRYCLNVMKGAGITFTSGNAEGIALNTCAGLYLLKAALDKKPVPVTLGATVGIIESLGTSYQKAGGLGQEFVPGRNDPLNKVFYWKFFTDCSCLHYYGSKVTIP